MKNKGFTLVELIAVLVLMGMLVLVVFPATSRLLRGNEEKKYQTYYDIVGEAVKKYARTRRDDIGGINGFGCVDDKTISDLVSLGYIKKFDQEEGVECKSPSEWSNVELIEAGIDPNPEKKYVNMRIDNSDGQITTSFSMICLKGKKVKFQMLLNEPSECKKYVSDVSSSLYSKIKKMKDDNIISVVQDEYDNYLDKMIENGEETINNNYVLYSGKLWRILSYNENNKTIKLVSDDIIAIRKYDNTEFNNSDLYNWLNVKDTTSTTGNFISSLKNPDKFIASTNWNFTAVSNDAKPSNTNRIEAKIGLLNYHEYSKAGDYIKNGADFWLLSTSPTAGKAWYVNSEGTPVEDNVVNYHGVRPTIVLKANVTITSSGSGEKTNPFRINGDSSASVGTIISTRFPGEYVKVNGLTYRIISTTGGYIKLIGTELLSAEEKKFDTKKTYSATDPLVFTKETSTYDDLANIIGVTLNSYITETTFCIYNATSSKEECNQLFSLALPRVGEMFTANSSKKYWTISNETKDKIYIVNEDGSLSSGGSEDKASILPVIVLKGNFAIVSGNGTFTSPYTIAATVKNVDTTKPTASCSASVENKNVTYKVTANDASGIAKYVHNGKTYTSSTFTVSDLVNNDTVRVYDKADNYIDVVCVYALISSGNKTVVASYDSSTLKYWIEKPDTYYTVTHIWVEDAYHQLNAEVNTEFGTLETTNTILNNAIRKYEYSNKGMIAVNASGFLREAGSDFENYVKEWRLSPTAPVIFIRGKLVRDFTNYTLPDTNPVYGLNKNGYLTYYTFGSGQSSISANKNVVEKMKSDGIRNTVSFRPVLVKDFNRVTNGTSNDIRQAICQIDKNNFVIITNTNSTSNRSEGFNFKDLADYMVSLNCRTGYNLDGGGSTNFYYKKNNSNLYSIVTTSRSVADILYFVEQ